MDSSMFRRSSDEILTRELVFPGAGSEMNSVSRACPSFSFSCGVGAVLKARTATMKPNSSALPFRVM